MLIISFDAVGDDDFETLMQYPTIAAFAKTAAVYRDIPSVFISNTYPVHASIVTGVTPREHGVVSNMGAFPMKNPIWKTNESEIRVKTLWQAAAGNGIDVAAVMWPITAFSKTIRYNIPEVLARPGENQLVTCLKAGSKWLQIKMVLRHGKLLKGIGQPARDYFATACMADILRERKPGLALMHLTAYDALCHKYGKGSADLKPAFESLDRNLKTLLEAAGDDRDVIVLSDHGQVKVHTPLEPNKKLVEAGLMRLEDETYIPGESGCHIECGGGSAFFHAGNLPQSRIDEIRVIIEQSEGFRRFLTDEEMFESGHDNAAFGFCSQEGYSYDPFSSDHKAQHGFTLDMPDYSVFYMARGFGLTPGSVTKGGGLLDIAPLAAKRLGVTLS